MSTQGQDQHQHQATAPSTADSHNEFPSPPTTKEMIPRAGPIKFGPFDVTSQVFHTTPNTFALVNLKPLLPGHILVCPFPLPPINPSHPPKPPSPFLSPSPPPPPSRLFHLTPLQTTSLLHTVQLLTPTLTRLFHARGFNVAIQDGRAAGQTVPHVHVHVIPRREGDMDHHQGGGDRLYEMLEGRAGDGEEGERKPRTPEEMRREAEWLRGELERDGVVSTGGMEEGVVGGGRG